MNGNFQHQRKKTKKISQYVNVNKDKAYSLNEATSKLEMSNTRPDVILLHTLATDIKELLNSAQEILKKILKKLMEEEISHQFSKGVLICEIQICGAEVTKFSNRTGTI